MTLILRYTHVQLFISEPTSVCRN